MVNLDLLEPEEECVPDEEQATYTNIVRKRILSADHQVDDHDTRHKRRKTDNRYGIHTSASPSVDDGGRLAGDLYDKLDRAEKRIKVLRRENRQKEEESERLRDIIAESEEKFELAQVQHEERAKQLHELRAMLLPDRCISGTEIMQLVRELNHEVQQVAASMVDAAKGGSFAIKKLSWEVSTKTVTAAIGDDTIGFLQNDPDGLFCQFALQAGIAFSCRKLIQEWSCKPRVSQTLAKGYENLRRNSEQPPIAALWRTMAKTEWKYSSQEDYLKFTRGFTDELVTFASSVLTLWKRFNDTDGVQYRLPRATQKALSKVVTLASKLDGILGKEVSDEDWMVFALDRKKTWDRTKMEVVNPEPGPVKVLCAVGLGLQKYRHEADDWQVVTKVKVVGKIGRFRGNVRRSYY